MNGRDLPSHARRLLGSLFFAGALMLSSSVAFPAAAQDEDAAESRATSFQAVEGNAREEVQGGPLLLGAYATVWIILIGYVGYMGLGHRRTEQQLRELRALVEAASKASGGSE